MSREVFSNTDSVEQVAEANGKAASIEEVKTSEAAPAEAKEQAETQDDSETPKQEVEVEAEESTGKEAGEEEGEESKEQETKKPGGFKKRIDKLTKRAAQAEQEREYWREQALKASKPQETKQVEAKQEAVPGKPVADQYATHEAYVEALTDWKIEQREKAKEVQSKQTEEQAAIQKKVDHYTASAKALAAKYEDHDEVIEGCDVNVPREIQGLILDSENGAELSYHLAKNEEELKRICALPLASAARELGKFEAKHIATTATKETKQIKTTKAPAPLKAVGTSGSASTEIWKDGDDDFQAFKKARALKKV